MNTQQLIYQIALTLIKGIGDITAKTLLAHMGSVEEIFGQSKSRLMKIPSIGEYVASQLINNRADAFRRAEEEIAFVEKNKIATSFYTDKSYPVRLKECPDAPIMLYGKGNRDLNEGRFVGIVGTRKMTDYGSTLCHELIKTLARHKNITIVSGLAYGVDICAHKAALDCGMATIGVLGHGLDRIYPAVHRPVAAKMVNQGGLLTEFRAGTIPDKPNFVQRNRIIAGMCDALVVIESGAKGGSLITAEIANSYNKDVFAFPGNVGNEQSAGCNNLIKTNRAILIENGADLEGIMSWESKSENRQNIIAPSLFLELSDTEKWLMSILKGSETTHINQLSSLLEMPMSKISPLLLEMEFNGLIKCLPGNLYKAI